MFFQLIFLNFRKFLKINVNFAAGFLTGRTIIIKDYIYETFVFNGQRSMRGNCLYRSLFER